MVLNIKTCCSSMRGALSRNIIKFHITCEAVKYASAHLYLTKKADECDTDNEIHFCPFCGKTVETHHEREDAE